MQRLLKYFSDEIADCSIADSVGIEVETAFVDIESGEPVSIGQSQKLLRMLADKPSWKITQRKNQLITEISDDHGSKLLYELGRQNIEFAGAPRTQETVIDSAQEVLTSLIEAGASIGIKPNYKPILETNENLLVIPDERDAIWLELDGREALELLARISAVQFTVSVPLPEAILCLNKLGAKIDTFLKDYPQEENWRRYIRESKAGYHPLRYGGPIFFESLEDYCFRLASHEVVSGPRLIPYGIADELNIPLFLRSVWWYFRLKRYGNALCIEVRPLPRLGDDKLQEQLDMVLNIIC